MTIFNNEMMRVFDHLAALAERESDWQLKYDLLMLDYEQKWGLSMRQAEQIAALQARIEALKARNDKITLTIGDWVLESDTLKEQIAALTATIEQQADWGKCKEEWQAEIAALTAEHEDRCDSASRCIAALTARIKGLEGKIDKLTCIAYEAEEYINAQVMLRILTAQKEGV